MASPTSRRRIAIAGGNESVVLFVQWLELDDDMLLEGIRLQRGGLPLASIASAGQAAAAKFLANN